MARGLGLTRRALIALGGLGGMMAGGRIFGPTAARAQPPRRHERLHRAVREMREAMEYIREAPAGVFQEGHKRRALEALDIAIREVVEMIR